MQNSVLLIFAILISISGCSNGIGAPNPGEIVYQNSFESQADLMHITGNGFSVAEEGGPESGTKSLFVSGGCVLPHMNLKPELSSIGENGGWFVISFYGRTDNNSGGILRIKTNEIAGQEYAADFSIKEKIWLFYESDPIFIETDPGPVIEGIAGGFASSNMYIDLITIKAAENR